MGAEGGPVADAEAGSDAGNPREGDGPGATFDCPYCDRRFAREAYRNLHLGQEHEGRLDTSEREAYETAHDAEAEAIRMFRLKALAVLVLVYFGFLVVYAFTL
jgi:hypothetical protein